MRNNPYRESVLTVAEKLVNNLMVERWRHADETRARITSNGIFSFGTLEAMKTDLDWYDRETDALDKFLGKAIETRQEQALEALDAE